MSHVSPDEDPLSDITELNDGEDNDDAKSDTVVDSVDTLLSDFFLMSIGMFWWRNRMKLVLNNT